MFVQYVSDLWEVLVICHAEMQPVVISFFFWFQYITSIQVSGFVNLSSYNLLWISSIDEVGFEVCECIF